MTVRTPVADRALTPQQEKFAQGVASGLNQSDAYKAAYPKSAKWNGEALRVAGAKMAALGNVSVRIKELTHKAADIAVLEGAEIIREIARVSFSDIAGIMHPDGRVKMPHELDPATRAAVASFEINQYGEIKYKFWDKNAALEKAAKIRGLYKEDNKQVADGLADLLGSLGGRVAGAVRIAPTAADGESDD